MPGIQLKLKMYLEIKFRKFNENKVILRFSVLKKYILKYSFSLFSHQMACNIVLLEQSSFSLNTFESACILCAKKEAKVLELLHSCSAMK